jgi:hypothetical protein
MTSIQSQRKEAMRSQQRPMLAIHIFLRRSASLDRCPEDVRVLPVIIAELELGDIERYILPAHFVERADDAALKNRPEAFDGLSVDCADNVLAFGMINGSVREIFVEAVVSGPLIGAKQADFVGNGFSDKCIKRCSLDVRDHTRNHIALATDCADDRRLAGTDAAGSTAAAAFIPMPVSGQSADESFIDFDNSTELVNVFHKGDADLMAHFPSGLIGTESHISIDLQSAHPLLAGQHQVNYAEPVTKWLVCVFEDSSGNMGKSISGLRGALIALPTPRHCRDLPIDLGPTARAADTIRPTAPHEIGAASVIMSYH